MVAKYWESRKNGDGCLIVGKVFEEPYEKKEKLTLGVNEVKLKEW